jgi:hypothetical protein
VRGARAVDEAATYSDHQQVTPRSANDQITESDQNIKISIMTVNTCLRLGLEVETAGAATHLYPG